MNGYLYFNQSGTLMDASRWLYDLPPRWTVVAVSDADFAAFANGYKAWRDGALVDTNLAQQMQNRATIVEQADTALTNNAAYLALDTPTTAQEVAQVRALTQQIDKLIRLALDKLDATT